MPYVPLIGFHSLDYDTLVCHKNSIENVQGIDFILSQKLILHLHYIFISLFFLYIFSVQIWILVYLHT